MPKQPWDGIAQCRCGRQHQAGQPRVRVGRFDRLVDDRVYRSQQIGHRLGLGYRRADPADRYPRNAALLWLAANGEPCLALQAALLVAMTGGSDTPNDDLTEEIIQALRV